MTISVGDSVLTGSFLKIGKGVYLESGDRVEMEGMIGAEPECLKGGVGEEG